MLKDKDLLEIIKVLKSDIEESKLSKHTSFLAGGYKGIVEVVILELELRCEK